MSPSALAAELAAYGRRLASEGLTWGTSGNLSARTGDGESMLVSASGTWMNALEPDDFVRVSLDDGSFVGDRRPTKEVPMHRAIYAARPEARWILHGSPVYTTWLACADVPNLDGLFIEAMHYLAPIAVAPYAHPGTPELGEAIGEAARTARVILMRNHGAIVWHENAGDALMSFLALEFAARVVHAGLSSGRPARPLPPEVAAEFRSRRVYKPAT